MRCLRCLRVLFSPSDKWTLPIERQSYMRRIYTPQTPQTPHPARRRFRSEAGYLGSGPQGVDRTDFHPGPEFPDDFGKNG